MKDSGIEWIGEIPQDWSISKVKHCFTRKNSKAKQDDPVVLSLARSGVKIRDISTNEGQLAESYYDYNPVQVGDLLLNPMDLYSGANCSYSDVEGVISPAYINLKNKEGVSNSKFYDYYFKVQYWMMVLFSFGKGVSFDNRWTLGQETLMNFPIVYPLLPEQQKIADFLDEKCSHIDSVLEKVRASIDEYKQLKQSIITQAVTKGVRPNCPMKDSGIEWIGEIPQDWSIIAHKYVMYKDKKICEHYNGEDIISLTMSGVIKRDLDAGGKMPTTFDGYQYVEPEDLLLCLFDIDVTPRCVGVVKDYGITSPAYSRFKVNKGYFNKYYDYLLRMIDNDKVFVHLAKNLRSSLKEDDFGAIKTIVPPMLEQKQISDYLDDKCSEIDKLITKKEQLIVELETYKKSLIYEYVTGKKEVK